MAIIACFQVMVTVRTRMRLASILPCWPHATAPSFHMEVFRHGKGHCCVFWPANVCFAYIWLVEIVLLTFFSITNGNKKHKNT